MRNPTSCEPATSTAVATPYGTPATAVTKTSTFTPTACDALPVRAAHRGHGRRERPDRAPGQAARADDHHPGRRGGRPVVRDRRPAADPRRRPDPARPRVLRRAGSGADVPGHGAGRHRRGGDAAARDSRSPAPSTSPRAAPAALPGLTIQLADPIPLRLEGSVELTPEGLKTTFTGLPDVPLSRFQLDLFGGEQGRVPARLGPVRRRRRRPVTAAFVAQSGKQAAESKPLAVAGCTDPPQVVRGHHAPAPRAGRRSAWASRPPPARPTCSRSACCCPTRSTRSRSASASA